MPDASLILLPDYAESPRDIIGERASELGRLHSQQVPIPRSFCIPELTLKAIAETNALSSKVTALLKTSNLSSDQSKKRLKKQLIDLFHQLRLPRNIAQDIIKHYDSYLGQNHVHVLPSNAPTRSEIWVHDNVKGDANLIKSLMQIWAEVVYTNVVYSPKNIPVQTLLFSTPLLVEWAPEADSSGLVYTKDPETGSKTEMTIQGSLGIHHPDHSEIFDVIKVDVRTWNVISQQTAAKTHKFGRGHDSLKIISVPETKQKQAILTRAQAEQLARLAFNIKQHSLEHLRVHWMLVGHQLLVTAIEPFVSLVPDAPTPKEGKSARLTTATELMISAGNADKAGEQISDLADGIGILRSEYAIARYGIHPQHVLKSKRHRTLLTGDLVKTIEVYQKHLGQRPLIYRTQNFTSAELSELSHSTLYEPKETNPYLGYRGGLKIISQPELFAFELSVLKEVLDKSASGTKIGCMLPFIRTPGELRSALDQITKIGLMQRSNFEIWLQLNTPENVLNLQSYPLQQVAGVSINIRSLHGLVAGIDPDNSEMMSRYPMPIKTITHLIEHTLEAIKLNEQVQPSGYQTKVYVHMENYNHDLTAAAIKLGVNGIIVKPQVAQIARECIIDTEAIRFKG